jgi:uridine kinase
MPASCHAVSVVSYAELAEHIRSLPPRAGSTRVVAVDGPAGSGKSVFAARLARSLSALVIGLDDLTPSWTGPDKEAPLLVTQVLAPLAAGGSGRYRFFDWEKDRYTEWREVPADPYLVVEGVGAGSRIARRYLSYLVWVEAPSELRLTRGLERDGAHRLPEWERWRAREDALFAREATRAAADVLVDGAPHNAHDPEAAFVAVSTGPSGP